MSKTYLKSGVEYLPKYNLEPGMNDDLAYEDRAGFCTSIEMLTTGSPQDWNDFSGPEVGNPYDMDPMGEERTMMTFGADSKALGHIGEAATEAGGHQEGAGAATTTGGKSTHLAPQNYNRVGAMKRNG